MSVTTTFDEKISSAKEHVEAAYGCLYVCMDKDTWGYYDMKEEYIDKVLECMKMLLEIKRKL